MNEITITPSPDAIDRAVEVIKTAHQDAKQIPAEVMKAGAILALQVGANPNPLAGELWIYQIKGRWTPYLGIAYYRRIAEENNTRVMFAPSETTPDYHGLSWEPRAMTPEEREYYRVPETTLAAICKGFRGDRLLELLDRGVPWRDAVSLICRTGIGYIKDEDMIGKDGKYYAPPNGRSWQWKCNKRAEVDLYRALGVVARKQQTEQQQPQLITAPAEEGEDVIEAPYTMALLNEDLF